MYQKHQCPRCGGLIPNNESPGAYPGALSRVDNKTEICSSCGSAEAFDLLPMSVWWSSRVFLTDEIEMSRAEARYGD